MSLALPTMFNRGRILKKNKVVGRGVRRLRVCCYEVFVVVRLKKEKRLKFA